MANDKDFKIKNGLQMGDSLIGKAGSVTGNATLDISTGNTFGVTPTSDVTFTFSNVPSDGVCEFDVKLSGVELGSPYDLANAQPPAYGKFSVVAQDTNPQSVFFKSDGTKLYILDTDGDDVSEYSLSSAWDITTASYTQGFSISAQEVNPTGLFFKPDGTAFFMTGRSGIDVNEYSLSSAWDVSTASYVQNFSVATEELNPSGIFFKSDGTKMYVTGFTGDDVNEYDLSSAWDISTASYVQNFSVAAQETTPTGVFFKPDGLKMYVVGSSGDDINEYTLSSAWDISTASYVQNFSVVAQETGPQGLFFKDDGLRMYIVGSSSDAVYSYTLTTAWDISTASFDLPTEGYFSVAAQDITLQDLFFKPDGTKLYILRRQSNDQVDEYSLSTAWDITTASFTQTVTIRTTSDAPEGLFFKPDGTKMYVCDHMDDAVNEYSLSTAWDVSSVTYVQEFSVVSQSPNPEDVLFKPDGTKMYVVTRSGDLINEYALNTAWDVSSASYTQGFSVGSQEADPSGVFFKPDGTSFYIIGYRNDKVYEYTLSSAWDVSTSSYVQDFSVASEESLPTDLFFDDSGTKMYIIGSSSDAIWQYTTGTPTDPATFTFPSSVYWNAGTPPAAPAVGEASVVSFVTTDGGTTYYGYKKGDNLS